ncbi:MAG TPA: hypothetical protein ENF48_05710 [Desulfobacteraceae bacterium]|nr:hypothetical protein [Deltaproteobacteria bacterium]HDI59834.1 hypothetical protein [Desulfobacteraceae bacterium]
MTAYQLFAIRAVLGIVFAVVILRFFYPQAGIPHVAGLAIFLVGMAYITEAWRHKRQAKEREPKSSS